MDPSAFHPYSQDDSRCPVRRLERLCLHRPCLPLGHPANFRRVPARFPGRAFARSVVRSRHDTPMRHAVTALSASCRWSQALRVRIPDEPLPERVHGQLETIRQAQFVENRGHVVTHRCLADNLVRRYMADAREAAYGITGATIASRCHPRRSFRMSSGAGGNNEGIPSFFGGRRPQIWAGTGVGPCACAGAWVSPKQPMSGSEADELGGVAVQAPNAESCSHVPRESPRWEAT